MKIEITPGLVGQWAKEVNAVPNIFLLGRSDGTLFSSLELENFAQRAAAYGSAQREKELMAVGMEPVASHTDKGFSQDAGLIWEETNLYTATQLAAARLLGAEEEREKFMALVGRAQLVALEEKFGQQAKPQAPYPECRFQICDLPGQCTGAGKCHHPAVPAYMAQSEQASKPLTNDAQSVGTCERGDEYCLRQCGTPNVCCDWYVPPANNITGEQA